MAQELTWVIVSTFYFQDFQSHLYLSTKNMFMWLKCMCIMVKHEKQWNSLDRSGIKNFDLKLLLKQHFFFENWTKNKNKNH